MNLKYSFILFATVALAMPCQAADDAQIVAVLPGRTSQMAAPDMAVQKALELLKKQELRHVDLKQIRPEAPRRFDRILILGGSEAIPM